MGNLAIPLTRPLTVPLTTVPAGLRLGGAVAAVGAAALLTGEANGFAADFTYATDAKRVAVKASSVVTEYAVNAFFANAGTSPKQVYNVAGTLVWSPHNMVLQSQTFEQTTPWNPTTTVTVTANAVAAPDATTTADRIVEVASSGNHQLIHANITVIAGATYTISVYAKAGERNWLAIAGANGDAIADFFDLTNGVIGNTVNGAVITSVGDGWYRCSITIVAAIATRGPCFYLRTSNGQVGTYAGDNTKGLYLWGAQLNRGSTPTAYLPTTTAARYGLALDHDPVTHAAKGLLCEPAATNLLLNNATLSTQSVTVTAVAYTLSFWGTGTVTLSGVSTAGPLVGTGANDRVSLTFTPTAGSLTCTVSGTVSRAQLETGSVATSPIPTYAASATRAVDQYNCTPAVINYSATAGTWWAEFAVRSVVASARVVGFTTTSYGPLYELAATTRGLIDGTSLTATGSTLADALPHKLASAFQSGARSVSTNGGTAATDAGSTTVLLSPGALIYFGSTAATNSLNGYVRKVFYLPRKMSDADLATETTP